MCVASQKKSSDTVSFFSVFLFAFFLQVSGSSDDHSVHERDPYAVRDTVTPFPVSVVTMDLCYGDTIVYELLPII